MGDTGPYPTWNDHLSVRAKPWRIPCGMPMPGKTISELH
jgi:hypothetical protein